MINRLEALRVLSGASRLSMAKSTQALGLVDKVLAFYVQNLPLADARALDRRERDLVEATLDEVLVMADLKKVSTLWEPARTITAGESQTELVDHLVSLLRAEREPYRKINLALAAARRLSGADREALEETISVIAPSKDITALVKKWDKHNVALQSASLERQVTALLDLLTGRAEPTPAPPKASKAKR